MTACVTLYAVTAETAPRPDMTPSGWGDPARRHGLPLHAAAWLRRELGPTQVRLPVAPESVQLPPAALPAHVRAALVAALGEEHVRDDHETRLLHAAGKSYLDLLAVRSGRLTAAPDAVVLPADA